MGQAVGNLQEYWDRHRGRVPVSPVAASGTGLTRVSTIHAASARVLPLKDPKTGLHYYTSGYDYTKMNNGYKGFQGDFMSNGIITPGQRVDSQAHRGEVCLSEM